ncbi:hypothetical protein PVK06_005844 [Gossypium arboreum]|uniref:RNase H type-1 domain-containing protein n=1 Tax=Gossypium arboreum TaxID=29729 RepID=A0ABR0QVM6_GOSAR|nr:hypothetical protein PVK06_005844 [Gossypium arboreum]
MLLEPTMEKGWKKPGQGVVKINFDATMNGRKMGFVLVARDHDGFVLGGQTGVLEKNVQAEWAELHTLEKSFSFVRTRNWLKLEFESDCISLVNRLNRMKVDFSTMGYRIRESLKMLNSCVSVSIVWAPHYCNKAADYLFKWDAIQNCITDFDMDYPLEIHDIILSDAIN